MCCRVLLMMILITYLMFIFTCSSALFMVAECLIYRYNTLENAVHRERMRAVIRFGGVEAIIYLVWVCVPYRRTIILY